MAPLAHRRFSVASPAVVVEGVRGVVNNGVSRAVSLAHPTFMVWGANTDVGKTLVSAGFAAAAVRAQVRLKLCVLPTPHNRIAIRA